jgi:F-type H+-transporting ATPase subunit b
MNNPLVQPDPGLYIWTILTFLVLVFLLAKFAWRPLLAALEQRQQLIRQSLDEARQARQELARVKADSDRILAEARSKADEILSATRTDANRFREETKEHARAEAATIVKNAERQIERETAKAVHTIRQEAVAISFEIASKLLQRNVSQADNERLVEETLSRIGSGRPH